MIPNDCDTALCPYWDGDSCPCAAFGIDPPGREVNPAHLPSASYERTEPTVTALCLPARR